MIYVDLELARRLERTEATSNARFVEARARLHPESGATWTEVAGAYALFDGPDSPLTQTFGLGLFGPVGKAELEEIEAFFAARQAPVLHEVSPLADPELLALLPARGYQPIEYTSVLYLPLSEADLPAAPAADPALRTRRIEPHEAELWARTSAAGWSSESAELSDFVFGFGRISAQSAGTSPFLAELEGEAIAAGGLFVHDGTALLAGASTVPAARRRGGQQALLAARLRYAAGQGATLAMMGAWPGSQSQRNAEKHGFRIAYTRIKWAQPGG
ncbi:hypothetical protein [Hymenobacter sp. B81]|uniref:hypothetical protein n=1 Tax=Hymenobacter sp. B81 TaxID=3344878 RepID=UPI0037DC5935